MSKFGQVDLWIKKIFSLLRLLHHRPEKFRGEAKRIEFWVRVASKCLSFEDYNGAFCIIVAINSSFVRRMTKTLSKVKKSSGNIVEQMNQLFSQGQNLKNFKETMNSSNMSTKYAGPYCSYLFLEQQKKTLEDEIDLKYIEKLHKVLIELKGDSEHLLAAPKLLSLIYRVFDEQILHCFNLKEH